MNSKEISESLSKFEIENDIKIDNEIYNYSIKDYYDFLDIKPWRSDPYYFKKVKISAVALIKMVTHAKMGGNLEVMGLMQGRVDNDTFLVVDTFPLPVEGTETRVNAGAEANEYMSQFVEMAELVGRKEFICGWYHSHPSYGCWLSGIDVTSQALYQRQDPWLALVIDPIRTMTSGKVEIGAFRTFPDNYSPPGEARIEDQVIPFDKIEDFGVHYKRYYQLEVSYYKNSLDSKLMEVLWSKYWVSSLTQSAIYTNKQYFLDSMNDLCKKAEKIRKSTSIDKIVTIDDLIGKNSKQNNKDFLKYSLEKNQAVVNEIYKNMLFSYKI